MLSVAFGTVDPIFRNPVPVWNPLQWYPGTFAVRPWTDLRRRTAFLGPPFLRTFLYVGLASTICLLIGYPVAYFVARYAGRCRGILLVLLIAPFWISYLMRMLAWVNLLRDDGLVNRSLTGLRLIGAPGRLAERPADHRCARSGVRLHPVHDPAAVRGARPDRPNLLEAARDLGASRVRTFARVTLPLSKQAILAGMVIVALPMFGDYYTNDLLSGSPKTSMIGNLIDDSVGTPGQGTKAAVLVLILTVILLIPMLYYVSSTGRATRERSGVSAVAARSPVAEPLPQPVAQAADPGVVHLALPGLVDPAGRHRGAVLVQRGAVAKHVAGVLAPLVLRGPRALGLARPQPPHRPVPDSAAGRAHDDHRGAAGGRVRASASTDGAVASPRPSTS